jgi:hypothetical protein
MSAHNTLTRRKALSLLGVTTGSVVATTLTAQAAGERSDEVIGAATSTRPRYIFGYGSLMDRESRMATWPSAEFASPAVVKGVARGWFDQTDVPSWSPTYLGGIEDEGAECNGVIFRVTPAEFDNFSQREAGYRATEIHPSRITISTAVRPRPTVTSGTSPTGRSVSPPTRTPSCSHMSTYASRVAWKSRRRIRVQSRPTSPSASSGRRATGDRHGSTTVSILGGHSCTCRAPGRLTPQFGRS